MAAYDSAAVAALVVAALKNKHADKSLQPNLTDWTEAAGASGKTFRMEVTVLPAVGKVGCTTLTSVTFDGA